MRNMALLTVPSLKHKGAGEMVLKVLEAKKPQQPPALSTEPEGATLLVFTSHK